MRGLVLQSGSGGLSGMGIFSEFPLLECSISTGEHRKSGWVIRYIRTISVLWQGVTLLWLPGHVGVLGNEKVYKLFKMATEKRFIGPKLIFGIPKSTRKGVVDNWLRNDHSKTWCEDTKTRRYFVKLGLRNSVKSW